MRREKERPREKKREGQKAKHGQLAVGNEGDSRYSGKRDRYHDARWQVDGNGESSMRSGTFIDAILLVN